ncbi:MAG: hypothetical protein PHP54_05030 [Clostridia bacterium]|nr:hypothetical protein [Clostridia bacterium]
MANPEEIVNHLRTKYTQEYPEIFEGYDQGEYSEIEVQSFFKSEEKKREERKDFVVKNKYIEIEDYCNDHNLQNDFSELAIAYSEYITAVVESTAYSKDMMGNSTAITRSYMENLNKNRRSKHNNTIQKTISLNNELIKGGHILYRDFIDTESISSIDQNQRDEFGDFIFAFETARAQVIRERFDKDRSNVFKEGLKAQTVPLDITNIEKVEHDYRITVPHKVDKLIDDFNK